MGFAKSTGYVQNFEGYATGWINPEYGYWKNMNNMPGLPERDYQDATDLAYFNLSMTGLYNGKKF